MRILEHRCRILNVVLAMAAVVIPVACGATSPPGSNTAPIRTVEPSISSTTLELRDGTPCSASALAVDAKTDRSTYGPGQRVAISVTARNLGRETCTIATGPCLPQVVITDDDGREVWNRAENQVECTVSDLHQLPAGETLTQTVDWDGTLCAGREPESCPGRAVPPGSYRLTAKWGSLSQGVATFSVTPY